MVRTASLFNQILGLVDGLAFQRMAREYQSNRFTKRFSAWDHFVTMVFCQLAHARSLRETCDGLGSAVGKAVHLGIQNLAKRSTLAYANEHRPSGFSGTSSCDWPVSSSRRPRGRDNESSGSATAW